MKKLFSLLTATSLTLPSAVLAQTPEQVRDELSGVIGLGPGLDTPGKIVSSALPYVFVFGGFGVLIMLVWGGFEMLLGATDQKAQESGKNRIVNAFKGFLILFSAYWLAQLAEFVFGISILNT